MIKNSRMKRNFSFGIGATLLATIVLTQLISAQTDDEFDQWERELKSGLDDFPPLNPDRGDSYVEQGDKYVVISMKADYIEKFTDQNGLIKDANEPYIVCNGSTSPAGELTPHDLENWQVTWEGTIKDGESKEFDVELRDNDTAEMIRPNPNDLIGRVKIKLTNANGRVDTVYVPIKSAKQLWEESRFHLTGGSSSYYMAFKTETKRNQDANPTGKTGDPNPAKPWKTTFVDSKKPAWQGKVLLPEGSYVIRPQNIRYTLNNGFTTDPYWGGDQFESGVPNHIPHSRLKIGGLVVWVTGRDQQHQIFGFSKPHETLTLSVGKGDTYRLVFIIFDRNNCYGDNNGSLPVDIFKLH